MMGSFKPMNQTHARVVIPFGIDGDIGEPHIITEEGGDIEYTEVYDYRPHRIEVSIEKYVNSGWRYIPGWLILLNIIVLVWVLIN